MNLKYYLNFGFLKAELLLHAKYLLESPYWIAKQYSQDEAYTYGETPLTTMEAIAEAAEIRSQDIVYELGCGRGRTCFWLHYFRQCKVVGIEMVPKFIQKAQEVEKQLEIHNPVFLRQDMLETDYSQATVVYLYGSCYNDEFIGKLADRLESVSESARIVSVSYGLHEYNESYRLMKQFSAVFTWGHADVFICQKIINSTQSVTVPGVSPIGN